MKNKLAMRNSRNPVPWYESRIVSWPGDYYYLESKCAQMMGVTNFYISKSDFPAFLVYTFCSLVHLLLS